MKTKTNMKKITARFRTSYIWWAVLVSAGVLLIELLIYRNTMPGVVTGVMLAGTALMCLVLSVIGVAIATSLTRRSLNKQILSCGNPVSFEYDDFIELGYSRHFFVSDNWLLWNRKHEYRILNRFHLIRAQDHPGQRADNKYAVCELYVQGENKPRLLYYTREKGIDVPALLNDWIEDGKRAAFGTTLANTVQTLTVGKLCPVCGTRNKILSRFCENCGSKL